MDDKVTQATRLCLKQAESFIEAADALTENRFAHIVYHLSLLALEEVGKASMLAARAVKHPTLDISWFDGALEDHRRKLHWAVWSPMTRLNPQDFNDAREFAERAHNLRLSTLYVNANTDALLEQITAEDARQVLALARERLQHESSIKELSTQDNPEADELTHWFLEAMEDPERQPTVLSKSSLAQYEALGGDARAWVRWVRDEVGRLESEAQKLMEAELARPGAPINSAKPRWRANATVYTPSHSLRAKVLAKWNDRIDPVKLLWTGRKDELILQITLHDNQPLPALSGRLITLCLTNNIAIRCLNRYAHRETPPKRRL
jgi:AbiV family abortive infection protein